MPEEYTLTVAKVIELLQKFPADLPVYRASSYQDKTPMVRVSLSTELIDDNMEEYVFIG